MQGRGCRLLDRSCWGRKGHGAEDTRAQYPMPTRCRDALGCRRHFCQVQVKLQPAQQILLEAMGRNGRTVCRAVLLCAVWCSAVKPVPY